MCEERTGEDKGAGDADEAEESGRLGAREGGKDGGKGHSQSLLECNVVGTKDEQIVSVGVSRGS